MVSTKDSKASIDVNEDQQKHSKSYFLDTYEEMRTRSDHDNGKWLVPSIVRRYRAIDVDKTHQRYLTRWIYRMTTTMEWSVSRTARINKAIDVDKVHQDN